jgi:transcriptional regulator with XRE-family HTH domain
MSESDRTLRDELINTKEDKEYRHAYAEENLNATIATQIKVLREQRHWKQEDLAEQAEMKQPMISRYENVNYSSWSINTLKKLAEAFDVYLDVRFRSFRELVESAETFSRETLQVPPFTEDPYFRDQPRIDLDVRERTESVRMSYSQLASLLNLKILVVPQQHYSSASTSTLSERPELPKRGNSAAEQANRGSTPPSGSALQRAA